MTRQVVVMVTSSYPRFPGDSVGTFMEPIAKSVAARGHDVHVVAPWHPLVTRASIEDGVRFHFYKYAPLPALNVFGYAAALRADVSLRGAAYLAAPLALAAGWRTARRVARQQHATVMHGHWVVPGGPVAALAAPHLPLVISLHGSDVYVAETVAAARAVAGRVFRRADAVTACSADLAKRAVALGADAARIDVVPYGVDAERFRPDPLVRARRRASLGLPATTTIVFTAGRLVRKKGFEYLIDAMARLPRESEVLSIIAGAGDLDAELRARAAAANVGDRVRFLGNISQDDVAAWLATADMVAIPSVRDDSGNVDGLPNIVMETLASGTPLVATPAGGIAAVVDHGRTGIMVGERDAAGLATAIATLARDAPRRVRIGEAARAVAVARFGWEFVAGRFEQIYDRALATRAAGR
ncbi:MAG TPA: glycosyltransferase [Vicinamibacterales bacterium]|nr:glycosyltransferase [Vicinamibacterales bacterium]